MRSLSSPIAAPNVSYVKLLSPFRYPGGKTWLVPLVEQWLASLPTRPKEFLEPFAGGAIVGLTVAANQLADQVTLVELDTQVAAVWHTIIQGDAEWLANRIANFDLTSKSIESVLSRTDVTRRERAFQTILRNRINRGGILAQGAGRIKYGENGKGLKSRWYPETLRHRILEIAKVRGRLTFIEGDGLEVLRQHANREDIAFFVDPPYTTGDKQAGRRLYTHHELDHEELFRITSKLAGDFLMTYSSDRQVREFALQHNLETREVAMKTNHHVKTTELLIGRDLNWTR